MNTETRTTLPKVLSPGTVYEIHGTFIPEDYFEQTDRNRGWITKEEQLILKNTTVGIAGCGGMGALLAAILTRLGIGTIKIADYDVYDRTNLNRQIAAILKTLGKPKALETARMLRDISTMVNIHMYPMGITEENARQFVKDCDIICDEIEFWALFGRMVLHEASMEEAVTVLNSSTSGHRVYLTKFTPSSMRISDVLGIQKEEALTLVEMIQNGNASKEDIIFFMNRMLRIASPEIPEYSLDTSLYSSKDSLITRLTDELTASIIATNPPMAAGFLANHVLFEILKKKSPIPRNFVLAPEMPGYLMFDAGLLETKIVDKIWW